MNAAVRARKILAVCSRTGATNTVAGCALRLTGYQIEPAVHYLLHAGAGGKSETDLLLERIERLEGKVRRLIQEKWEDK